VEKVRKYGNEPFRVVVIHGGPGGAGQVASVARELSKITGVLEPIQTEFSINGQVQELYDTLKSNSNTPITLIGHSWGAMLSIIFASKFPTIVNKLILISCGPLESKYISANVMNNRLNRMSDEEKKQFNKIINDLENSKVENKNTIFTTLSELMSNVDSYDPALDENEFIDAQYDIFANVWDEAETFRSESGFEDAVRKIKCPMIAIHGDYDPHPAKAIKDFLSSVLTNFEFILLDKCGHYPWLERKAKKKFYSTIKDMLIR